MKYRHLVLLLPLLVSGCFWESNIQQVAQKEMVQFTGSIVPNEDAELILEKEFRASEVPWDEEMISNIDRARNAITGMGEYIQDRLNFDSSVAYYNYKNWFEFTSYQYMKLQGELDKRVAIDGAISEHGKVIYEYVKRDVNSLLEIQRLKISATEKSIEDKASADTLEDMKNIYKTIKPLVEMVL